MREEAAPPSVLSQDLCRGTESQRDQTMEVMRDDFWFGLLFFPLRDKKQTL